MHLADPTAYENLMELLKPEALMAPFKEEQSVLSGGGRTPRDCQKLPELRDNYESVQLINACSHNLLAQLMHG